MESDDYREAMKRLLESIESKDMTQDDDEFFDRFRKMIGKAESNEEMFERWRELAGVK